jgi:hypothetical protein
VLRLLEAGAGSSCPPLVTLSNAALDHLVLEDKKMKPELIATLREAAEAVRLQIPNGELTRGSVEKLLAAAEAVCAEASAAPAGPAPKAAPRVSKRQEARDRWAKIAQQNEKESGQPPAAVE